MERDFGHQVSGLGPKQSVDDVARAAEAYPVFWHFPALHARLLAADGRLDQARELVERLAAHGYAAVPDTCPPSKSTSAVNATPAVRSPDAKDSSRSACDSGMTSVASA